MSQSKHFPVLGDVAMMILLKIGERDSGRRLQVKDGISCEEIYKTYAEDAPYIQVAAKVNNQVVPLSHRVFDDCEVTLLDIRHQEANLIYQYSLSLLYICAVRRVMGGKANVEILNSLNKGLYTELMGGKNLLPKQVEKIYYEMRQMVKSNLPFVKRTLSRKDAIELTRREGRWAKARLLEQDLEREQVDFYELDGYMDFFHDFMVPSTSYLKLFELKKYRKGILLRFPHPSMPEKIMNYVDERKLYYAFAEQRMWDDLLGVRYVADLNDKVEKGRFLDLVQLSEALHEKKIAEIADRIKRHKKRIILIAGPSSSGKTTFARRLCVQLRVVGLEPLYLGTDDYFKEREDTPLDEFGEKDFESLKAIDIDLFNKDMNGLLNGEEVDLPTFDFMDGHKEFGKRITKIGKHQPIVIEGIHALNERLTPYIRQEEKFKIYISPLTQMNIDEHNRIPTTDERMLRRLVRDNLFRGHDGKSTISEWPKVRAGEDKNIFPYSDEADVLFNSYHVYEIAVLKKYAQPLLEAIDPEDKEYGEAQRMLKFLEFFKASEDDSVIVNNSIIREFIGGSIFG